MSLPQYLIDHIEAVAEEQREEGWVISVNYALPTVSISFEGETEYFFQGEEAENLLEDVPEEVYAADYILYSSINW